MRLCKCFKLFFFFFEAISNLVILSVDHDMLLNKIHEWLSTFSHFIESQDACTIDEVRNKSFFFFFFDELTLNRLYLGKHYPFKYDSLDGTSYYSTCSRPRSIK